MAAGLALEVLGLDLHPTFRLLASLLLVCAGIVTPIAAWIEWMAVERALREGKQLPRSPFGVFLALTVSSAGVLVLLAMLL